MFTAFPIFIAPLLSLYLFIVPLLSGQPLLSGHFSKSRGWPLNRDNFLFCRNVVCCFVLGI